MEEYENQEDYRGSKKSKKLTMKQIILEQIKTIIDLTSQEIRGGYEEESVINIDGMPQIVKKYIPDGRQAYCNAVTALDVAIVNYVIGADNPKANLLLEGLNQVKIKQKERYIQYLMELKKEGVDSQKIKYVYFSDKRKLHEDMFRQLMIILKRSGFEDEE